MRPGERFKLWVGIVIISCVMALIIIALPGETYGGVL